MKLSAERRDHDALVANPRFFVYALSSQAAERILIMISRDFLPP